MVYVYGSVSSTQVPTQKLRCTVASKVTQFPIYPAGGAVCTSLYQKNKASEIGLTF